LYSHRRGYVLGTATEGWWVYIAVIEGTFWVELQRRGGALGLMYRHREGYVLGTATKERVGL
jgi:hypothetical protein